MVTIGSVTMQPGGMIHPHYTSPHCMHVRPSDAVGFAVPCIIIHLELYNNFTVMHLFNSGDQYGTVTITLAGDCVTDGDMVADNIMYLSSIADGSQQCNTSHHTANTSTNRV